MILLILLILMWKHASDFIMKHRLKIGIVGVIAGSAALALVLGGASDVSVEKLRDKYDNTPQIKQGYQLEGAALKRNIVKNAELDKYKNEPKDEIKVTIGDKDKTEFTPDIELKRWNEVSFKIKPKGLESVATKDKTLSFENDKIKFGTPKMSFEMYDYTEGEGGFKYIWYLNEKPASNIVSFDIETSGLDFFYQPELTPEEIAQGTVRPENIVGSYAVYHSTKGGMNDAYGKDYKTGQAFFIYRPHLIDANGLESWGNLHIENGIYSVEIPQDFLDKAVYPIKSNDTFGYTTAGGSWDQFHLNYFDSYKATAPGNGTVTKISIHAGDPDGVGGGNLKAVLINQSDLTIVTNGVGGTIFIPSDDPRSWRDLNYGTSPSIVTSTVYLIGVVEDGNFGAPSFNSVGSQTWGVDSTNNYTTPQNLGSATYSNLSPSIYATYTSSGGEAAPAPVDDFIIIQE